MAHRLRLKLLLIVLITPLLVNALQGCGLKPSGIAKKKTAVTTAKNSNDVKRPDDQDDNNPNPKEPSTDIPGGSHSPPLPPSSTNPDGTCAHLAIPSNQLDFDSHIVPIMNKHCESCHNADSELVLLDTYEQTNKDTMQFWGQVIDLIKGKVMPPSGNGLDHCELSLLDRWHQNSTNNDVRCEANSDIKLHQGTQHLSPFELSNTLKIIFGSGVTPFIESTVKAFSRKSNYINETIDDVVSLDHVYFFRQIAYDVINFLESIPGELTRISQCDPNDSDLTEELCFKKRTLDLGRLFFRRPLTAIEADALVSAFYDLEVEKNERFKNLILSLMQSSAFIYKIEPSGLKEPTEFTIATRLAFALWKSGPDEWLLNQAASGSLGDPVKRKAVINDMMNHIRTIQTYQDFFSRVFSVSTTLFNPQPDFYLAGLDLDDLIVEATMEFHQFIEYLLKNNGMVSDLFNSRKVFVPGKNLSLIYGLPISSEVQELPSGQRSGALTRVGSLLQESIISNPVKRGHYIREKILCEPIEAPKQNLNASNEGLGLAELLQEDELISTRHTWEKRTGQSPCNVCHVKMNPLGFPLEAYDTLGRFRETELRFNDMGDVLAEFPLDLTGAPLVTLTDQQVISGPIELSSHLSQNAKVNECLQTQMFRYIYSRREQATDKCSIAAAESGQPKPNMTILDSLRDYVTRKEFYAPAP